MSACTTINARQQKIAYNVVTVCMSWHMGPLLNNQAIAYTKTTFPQSYLYQKYQKGTWTNSIQDFFNNKYVYEFLYQYQDVSHFHNFKLAQNDQKMYRKLTKTI